MAKKKEETQEAETEVAQGEFEAAQSENVEVLNSETSQPVKGKSAKRIQISVYLSPESYAIAKKLEPVTRKSLSETISDWVDIYADMNTEASKEADKISAMLGSIKVSNPIQRG